MIKQTKTITTTVPETGGIFQRKAAVQAYKAKAIGITASLILAISAFIGASSASAAGDNYSVKKGDTLFKIAAKYKVTVQELKRTNGLKTDMLKVGQHLTIAHDNTIRIEATVNGVADGNFVEFAADNGEILVLMIPNGNAESFADMEGKKLNLVYKAGEPPVLVSYSAQ
ncbi:LysM peptidoglycan-binding domain-containing protein [Aneurinibacillus tyrosinisolvens]|uniref:LysM peptidoglycan-binding domain-containing protein n=1 Tax=Aneurinibacillus tyrosinisolvens TaxID=1443435 RepID=UPI00069AB9C6|nr:LysM peptidoglycan-binding domain-containing protein [Aneurinibacillus tyrosinisolvens]